MLFKSFLNIKNDSARKKKDCKTSKKYLITINNEYIFTQVCKLINIYLAHKNISKLSKLLHTELNKLMEKER